MSKKIFPLTKAKLQEIVKKYPTPFHIYDEHAIRQNIHTLQKAFAWAPSFREQFAVKALPNPRIVQILHEEGAGTDCSSLAELLLSDIAGVKGEKILLTSNDTPADEFQKAIELGAIINLDDISHIEYLEEHAGLPKVLCFRYNPGDLMEGNDIIGKPTEAKYGLTREQIFAAYRIAQEKGVKRFGLHTMVASNERRTEAFLLTAKLMFTLAVELKEKCGIEFELPKVDVWCYAGQGSETTEPSIEEYGRYSGNVNDGKGGSSTYTEVGLYKPNSWGLYDFRGNVAEWTQEVSPFILGGGGQCSDVRGGSWKNDSRYTTCAKTTYYHVNAYFGKTSEEWGFRVMAWCE